MRRKARKDLNQDSIVASLRGVGATVYVTNNPALPDLVVGYRGRNFLLEVKGDKGRLTPDQVEFFDTWRGQAEVVHNEKEALLTIGTWGG